MKKILSVILALSLLTSPLTACSNETASAPESTVSADSMSVADYLDLGNKYLLEGNYKEAIIAFTAAIDIDPNNTDAYLGRARTYVAEAKSSAPDGIKIVDWPEELVALYKQAENDYLKAISIDQQLVDAYLELADLYIEQGETDKALEILQQGISEDFGAGLTELVGKLEGAQEEAWPTFVTVQGYEIPTNITRLTLAGPNNSWIDVTDEEAHNYKLSEPLTDISFLSAFKNLEDLQVWDNQVTDLTPLSELSHLKKLDVRYNLLSDLSPLAYLDSLEELDARENQVIDISPLSDLSNLERLYLADNSIVDISPLSEMFQLNNLSLGWNQINNIISLSQLENLTELDLRANPVNEADVESLRIALPNCLIEY